MGLYTEDLSRQEVERLLHEAPSGLKELLDLGFHTGLSIQEALTIKCTDVKVEEQKVALPDRDLLLPKELVHRLAQYIKAKPKDFTDMLFKTHYTTLSRVVPDLSMEAIGKPISWYAVRHTYVKLASKAGVPTAIIENNAGVDLAKLEPWLDNGTVENYKKQLNAISLYNANNGKKG